MGEEQLTLNTVEQIALKGLSLRQQELQAAQTRFQQAMTEFTNDMQSVFSSIENRVGLEKGAIGTTHRVEENIIKPLKTGE